jgi:UDP-glucose 4-epimerase
MYKSILVTGGCGFIGSNLIPMLIERGYNVKALDNLSRGHLSNLQGTEIDFFQVDIRNSEEIKLVVKNVDAVIHLAAYGSVVESVAEPKENFDVNVYGTLSVLQACVNANVKKFIFASTGGALIGNAEPPVNEKSLPKPISPYGASKLCGEAYCNAFANSYNNIQTVCLRFANVYGPYSAHKKGAVTAFIKALMIDNPIIIYGDGTASRDFMHVKELCRGIIAGLETQLEAPNTVFHLASGVETSILELANQLAKIAEKPDHPIEFKPPRQGEVTRNFAAYDLAEKVLGFKPHLSREEGLQKTWNWFQTFNREELTKDTSIN